MIQKLLFAFLSLSNSALLILMICLGSQNLSSRHKINLGFSVTEQYPSGFLIGVSIALGSLSGGLTSGLLAPSKQKNFN